MPVVRSALAVGVTGLILARRFVGSLYRNLGLFVLAFIMAAILWAVVTGEENPTVEGTFPADIPVKAVNVPGGLDVYGEIDPVRVRVSAPRDEWSSLRASSFNAEVDLGRRNAGREEAGVEVTATNPQVRVLEVMPAKVTVWLEAIKRRDVSVRVVVLGEPPFGVNARKPNPEVEKVSISGPASLVDEVEAAVAEVNVAGATVTINRSFKLTPRSLQGRAIEGVRMEPATILVEVPIEQQILYKTVPVHPVINGNPAPGYWIESISVDPSIVVLMGPGQTLETHSFLQTMPVNVEGTVNSVDRMVEMAVPEGAWLAGAQKVRVIVNVSTVDGTKTFSVAPTFTGLAPELRASADPVEVTVVAPQPVLRQLDASNLRVAVDVSNLVTGTYTLTPYVAVPERTKLVKVTPEQVRAVIR